MMIVIDDGVKVGKKTAPKKQEQQPEHHQVVLHQPVNRNIPCTVCLLKTVFRMSDKQATFHAERARKSGAEPVLVTFAEIAETKAVDGNAAAQASADRCHPRARQISFTTERAP